MLYNLVDREPLDLHVLHDRNPIFVTLSDGSIRNGYDIKILNKTHEDRIYSLAVSGLDRADLRVVGAGNIDPNALSVFADSVGHFRLYLVSDPQVDARHHVTFTISEVSGDVTDNVESVFVSRRYE